MSRLVHHVDGPLYLDDHHLGRDVLRQPDGSLEVHRKSHQQVDDGHQVLGVDRCDSKARGRTVSSSNHANYCLEIKAVLIKVEDYVLNWFNTVKTIP